MKFKLTKKVRIIDTDGQATVIGFRPSEQKYMLRLPTGEIRYRKEHEVMAWQTRVREMTESGRMWHQENQWEARTGR